MLGLTLKAVPPDDVAGAIDDDTAVVTLTHVDYRSAAVHDMAAINAAAHAAGALSCGTCRTAPARSSSTSTAAAASSPSVAATNISTADPARRPSSMSPSGCRSELHSPLQGWMGHAEPFAFVDDYQPADGILKFLTGTPSILALAALDAGLGTFDGIAMRDLAAKSRSLSQLFIGEVEARCGDAVRLASPRDPLPARQPRRLRASGRLCRDAGADRARRDRRFPRARPDAVRLRAALQPLCRHGPRGRNPRRRAGVGRMEPAALQASAARSPDRRVPRPRAVDAPRPGARRGEIEEDEAEQDCRLTHVHGGPGTLREVAP